MYIYVDELQNIYFNMKDSEHVANAIFLFFIWDNQGSYFFINFCLLKHYSASWGSRAHLGPQKLSHF